MIISHGIVSHKGGHIGILDMNTGAAKIALYGINIHIFLGCMTGSEVGLVERYALSARVTYFLIF
jgi:hypothetical protein